MTDAPIPYGHHEILSEDIDEVVEVLRSDWLTQGPAVPRFEEALAARCGSQYAVAVNSATSALHLACLSLGLGPGDSLWTCPNSFVASADCGRLCGASIDFVDIDPRSYNMSVRSLAAKLADASRRERIPKVLVPVHFAGQPCEMEEIHALAGRYNVRVVEDAAHAVGARYTDGPVGNCRFSDVTVFSFHPVKIITTGEGGVAVTNDPALAARMRRLRSHGVTRDRAAMERDDGPWYYQQIEPGFNYRMTDFQAALGHSQLRRVDDYVLRRVELAARYDQLLAGLPVIIPWRSPNVRSAMHLYAIQLAPEYARRAVFDHLRSAGIGVNVHYIPIHTQPSYRQMGFLDGDFPEAERYYDRAITLPLYPGLTETQQDTVVTALRAALS